MAYRFQFGSNSSGVGDSFVVEIQEFLKRKPRGDLIMVNREYIKSKIDTLPEEMVIDVDKYIKKQIKNPIEDVL